MRGCGLAALACCFSTIRICSHGGKTRGFQRALYYAIVLPEPFQNGTASISLVMPVVRGNVRMHREMVFPKGGTLVLPPPPEGVRTSQFWLTDETAYSGAQRQVYEGIDRVFWQRHCVLQVVWSCRYWWRHMHRLERLEVAFFFLFVAIHARLRVELFCDTTWHGFLMLSCDLSI